MHVGCAPRTIKLFRPAMEWWQCAPYQKLCSPKPVGVHPRMRHPRADTWNLSQNAFFVILNEVKDLELETSAKI
jgi:hypothetical protein